MKKPGKPSGNKGRKSMKRSPGGVKLADGMARRNQKKFGMSRARHEAMTKLIHISEELGLYEKA